MDCIYETATYKVYVVKETFLKMMEKGEITLEKYL